MFKKLLPVVVSLTLVVSLILVGAVGAGAQSYSLEDGISFGEIVLKDTTAEVTSIAVTTLPNKVTYAEAVEELDVTGGVITVYYDDDTTEEFALDLFTVSGFDNTVVGEQTLTVTCGGFTTTFTVTVVAKQAASIAVTTLPSKVTYTQLADALDVTGGKVTVSYNNGTTEVIDLTAAMVSGFDNTVVGEQTLTVTYAGLTTTYTVTVEAAAVVPTHKPGDVTGDGKVNNKDLGLLLQYVNGWDVEVVEAAADVTGEGKINNKDLGLLLQYVNGWDVELK